MTKKKSAKRKAPKTKFKVGDRVKIIGTNKAPVAKGSLGYVDKVDQFLDLVTYEVTVDKTTEDQLTSGWLFHDEHLEKVSK